jgi:hypothetical protein
MAEPAKSLPRQRDTGLRTQPIDSAADSGNTLMRLRALWSARPIVLPANGRFALPPARSLANIH